MPTTTKRTTEPATKAAKTKKIAPATTSASNSAKSKGKKKTAGQATDFVVVGPIASLPETSPGTTVEPETTVEPAKTQTPAITFESGTRQTRVGNTFDVTVSEAGELVVRYQDRTRQFGDRMKVVVVSDPGPGEGLTIADLAPNGAVHEARIQLSAKTATVALAFAGAGHWDSNESRNYHVRLQA